MKEEKKKSIIPIVIILVGFVIALFGISLSLDVHNEALLKKEISGINHVLNSDNFDEDELDARLSRTITENEYSKVEKAYKSYMKDNLKILNELKEFYSNDESDNILTIENLSSDGKDLKVSKELIKSSIKNLKKIQQKYNDSFDEDNIMSYIDDKDLDKRYIDFYKNEIVNNLRKTSAEKNLMSSIDTSLTKLGYIKDAVDFLISNKNNYIIENDELKFNSTSLLNEYNKIIDNINE